MIKLDDLKVGKRVKVKSLGIKGKIEYIDQPTLFDHHMKPIQILLDEPYIEDSDTKTVRTSAKDLKAIIKGRKRNGKKNKSG